MDLDLATAIRYHLGSNHFPRVDPIFDASAIEAVRMCRAEDWEHTITLPNGVVLTAGQIVDQLHLELFLDSA